MTATSDSRVATDEIAHLYRRHHRDLQRAVAAAVRAPRELIEDACQNAWTIMLRSQPRRDTWFAWLRVVAIREAWQQCARSRNERPAGAFISPEPGEIGAYEYPDPPADARDIPDQVADRIQHVQRLADLTAIKPHDRRTLYLMGLGYRYAEIAKLS
jgi:DNA-directed RNA polymerase specialized sigma24 family protein